MSDDSIPAPDDQHKPVIFINEAARVEILTSLLFLSEAKPLSTDTLRRLLPSCDAHNVSEDMLRCIAGGGVRAQVPTPAKPKRRRPPRVSGLRTILHAAQQHGITHPTLGGFLQLPREFDAILALEHKAVAQVVLEILRQTIGTVVYDAQGHATHRE